MIFTHSNMQQQGKKYADGTHAHTHTHTHTHSYRGLILCSVDHSSTSPRHRCDLHFRYSRGTFPCYVGPWHHEECFI